MTQQTRTNVRRAGPSPGRWRSGPGRRGLGATPVAACAGLVLGMLALGPGLLPGYMLSYDMVFVPAPQFNAAMLGTAGTLPRAVPSDAVVAAMARALPADLVQKLVLLAIFVLACAGAARLLSKERMPAQLAAGVLYAWNPFVAERLILGQWALLLGYAGLPWVLAAAARPGVGVLRRVPRLAIALLPAAVGGFAAMSISALVALPAAALARRAVASGSADSDSGDSDSGSGSGSGGESGGSRLTAPALAAATARVLTVLAVLAVLSLPWLIPSLSRQVDTSTAGVAAFAARADTPFGTAGSLVMLGGSWNAQAVPAGYGGPFSVLTLCLAFAGLSGFLLYGWRRWPGLGVGAAAGLLIALLGAFGVGQELLRTMISGWPGFAVLRDGQQFVAPLALVEATGIGLVVGRLLRLDRPRVAREGRAILAAAIIVLPVVILPGLAWGAAGRLRPVEYPADWLAARRLINADPRPGRALLLPWGAYRRFTWNHGEALLDPWPRLLARQVVWNDGVQVGSLQIPPEDPSATAIDGLVLGSGPLTRELQARGYRYVIVDAGPQSSSAGGGRAAGGPRPVGHVYPFSARLPGCRVVLAGPDVVVYQVPG